MCHPYGPLRNTGLFNSAVYWWQGYNFSLTLEGWLGMVAFQPQRWRMHEVQPSFTTLMPFTSFLLCYEVHRSHGNLPGHIKSQPVDKLVRALAGDCFDLLSNYALSFFFWQHWHATLSEPCFLNTLHNNEAVRFQRQADRADVTAGMMCAGGISHVATTSHIEACYITL